MNASTPFAEYLKSTLAQVPPGRGSREVVDQALTDHDGILRAIAMSSADVVAKEQRMDQARTSLIATLYTLIDTEQPEQPARKKQRTQEQPAQELPEQQQPIDVSPLDKLIEERS